MGIDVPNIHTVFHWGPPNDIESYVQETGRGGRNGEPTRAILYYNKRDVARSGHVNESMRMYCIDIAKCRRQQLMKQFSETGHIDSPEHMHSCCDVCADQCVCEACTTDTTISRIGVELSTDCSSIDIDYPSILPSYRKLLKKELMEVHENNLLEPASLLVGADILSGLTNSTIEMLIKNCSTIKSIQDVLSLGVSPEFAAMVYEIVSKYN